MPLRMLASVLAWMPGQAAEPSRASQLLQRVDVVDTGLVVEELRRLRAPRRERSSARPRRAGSPSAACRCPSSDPSGGTRRSSPRGPCRRRGSSPSRPSRATASTSSPRLSRLWAARRYARMRNGLSPRISRRSAISSNRRAISTFLPAMPRPVYSPRNQRRLIRGPYVSPNRRIATSVTRRTASAAESVTVMRPMSPAAIVSSASSRSRKKADQRTARTLAHQHQRESPGSSPSG